MPQFTLSYRFRRSVKNLKGYLYIMPAVVFLILFTVYPILRSAYLSFFDTDQLASYMNFIGFQNYLTMFHDPVFWEVSRNTVIFGVPQVILTTVLGIALALAANSTANRFKSLFKVALFYPYILPWTVAAMIWMYMLHPTRGTVNALLNLRIQWLNSYSLTLLVLVLISVWKTIGFNFMLYLSGLQSIPNELYDAFKLESSSGLQRLWHITLPMLSPTTFAAALLSIVGSFQSVDLIYIMTQGRPGNSTNTLIYYIYQQGITNWKIGYGSALSTILFAALLLFTIVYLIIGERKVHYDR